MKPIPYGTVKRLIQSCTAMRSFKKEFTKILRAFYEYPKAIDIVVYGYLEFNISLKEYDDTKSVRKSVGFNTRVLAAKSLANVKEYLDIVLKHIYEDVTVSLNEFCNTEERWVTLESMCLVDQTEPRESNKVFIHKFLAWEDDSVGIWYVEQECGEHWITLPKSWKIDAPIFHTNIDRHLTIK